MCITQTTLLGLWCFLLMMLMKNVSSDSFGDHLKSLVQFQHNNARNRLQSVHSPIQTANEGYRGCTERKVLSDGYHKDFYKLNTRLCPNDIYNESPNLGNFICGLNTNAPKPFCYSLRGDVDCVYANGQCYELSRYTPVISELPEEFSCIIRNNFCYVVNDFNNILYYIGQEGWACFGKNNKCFLDLSIEKGNEPFGHPACVKNAFANNCNKRNFYNSKIDSCKLLLDGRCYATYVTNYPFNVQHFKATSKCKIFRNECFIMYNFGLYYIGKINQMCFRKGLQCTLKRTDDNPHKDKDIACYFVVGKCYSSNKAGILTLDSHAIFCIKSGNDCYRILYSGNYDYRTDYDDYNYQIDDNGNDYDYKTDVNNDSGLTIEPKNIELHCSRENSNCFLINSQGAALTPKYYYVCDMESSCCLQDSREIIFDDVFFCIFIYEFCFSVDDHYQVSNLPDNEKCFQHNKNCYPRIVMKNKNPLKKLSINCYLERSQCYLRRSSRNQLLLNETEVRLCSETSNNIKTEKEEENSKEHAPVFPSIFDMTSSFTEALKIVLGGNWTGQKPSSIVYSISLLFDDKPVNMERPGNVTNDATKQKTESSNQDKEDDAITSHSDKTAHNTNV
ncbi:hypothetical protein HHI36_002490 [Cryptolaemus montrouzieri]|uniref:Uncharacterized protein n=1 Tax=Cryptolaemus montrouzieri TaxID=559131 RepID=A0ABD2PBB6_9CUCU